MSLKYIQFTKNANKEMLDLIEQIKENCGGKCDSTKVADQIKEVFLRDYAYIKYALDSSTIVAVTDKRGIISYVNDKFCETSQYNRDELIGNIHRIVNSGYHDHSFYKDMWSTILSGENWNGEVKNRKKDGSFYWVQSNIIPIINEHTNEIEQFIALRTDITKGKEAEEQLRKIIQNDFERTIRNLDNMVFKVKKNQYGECFLTLVEGKLSKLLDISEGLFDQEKISAFFGAELVTEVIDKCHAAFRGEKHSIKHHFNGLELYTTLSPIIENGRIIEIIGNTNDITILELAQQEIQHMDFHDDLTNLPNRRKLSKDMQENLDHRPEQSFAVLFVDIDRFKQINDTMGFQRGDKLIIELSTRLHLYMNGKGTAYHLGGDEFVLILENYKNDRLLVLEVQNILKLVEEPFLIEDHELIITCSIG